MPSITQKVYSFQVDGLNEDLKIPVLILHSEDDPVASFEKVEKVKHRFPDLTIVSFSDGGHMMAGHGEEIDKILDDFLNKHS
ncbi:MAG: alpha/beta hydrolase [Clostridiaceae bacterium]|nr:alpha/beta hydrolase [Clostridiaceae bacterium]